MDNPLANGFRRLASFDGRDRRGLFWPYAGIVFCVGFLCMGLGAALAIGDLFTEISTFAAEHPEAVTVHRSPGQVSMQIDPRHPEAPVPDFSAFVGALAAGVAIIVGLLAAAVARRLHDVGRSAWWGLTPVIFLVVALTLFPRLMNSFATEAMPDMRLFGLLIVNNLIYVVSLVALVVMLALPGKPQPNRFGPPST